MSPTQRYSVKLCALAAGLLAIVLIHFARALFRKNRSVFYRKAVLVSTMGTFLWITMLSVVDTIIAPLRCVGNPNGRHTVRTYQSVICWTDEHRMMMLLSSTALLMPLIFLGTCLYVTWVWPTKVRNAEAGFLKAFDFLVFRFRPEACWYGATMLVRSVVLAAIPVIPYTYAQVTLMLTVLCPCLILVSHTMPWRAGRASWMDILTTAMMLLLTCISSFFAEETETRGLISILITIFLSCFLLILISGFFAFLRLLARKHKPYKYFVCHHKAGAGALARLPKLKLGGRLLKNQTVFVDSDNLRDLDTLFEHVVKHTETLLVVCSESILLRPWCAGEITTAHCHEVMLLKLVLSGFHEPSDAFIADYGKVVPNLDCIFENGIALEDLQVALSSLRKKTGIAFPEVSTESLDWLVGSITQGQPANISCEKSSSSRNQVSCDFLRQGGSKKKELSLKVIIVADERNPEGMSSAFVMAFLLEPILCSKADHIPAVLPRGPDLSKVVRDVVFMFSSGCFHQARFLSLLLQAAELHAAWVPVVCDEGFRFPTTEILLDLEASAPLLLEGVGSSASPGDVSFVVELCFKEIAVCFEANQSAADILEVEAQEVARWICRSTKRSLFTDSEASDSHQFSTRISGCGGSSSYAARTSTRKPRTTHGPSQAEECSVVPEVEIDSVDEDLGEADSLKISL